MGFGSAVYIFDDILELLDKIKNPTRKDFIKTLIVVLEKADWDTQMDSYHYEDEEVLEIFKELHPNWFDDEEGN